MNVELRTCENPSLEACSGLASFWCFWYCGSLQFSLACLPLYSNAGTAAESLIRIIISKRERDTWGPILMESHSPLSWLWREHHQTLQANLAHFWAGKILTELWIKNSGMPLSESAQSNIRYNTSMSVCSAAQRLHIWNPCYVMQLMDRGWCTVNNWYFQESILPKSLFIFNFSLHRKKK